MTRLWDLTAEDPISSAQVLEHDGRLLSVAFSPDSRWLVTVSRGNVRMWDLTLDAPAALPVLLRGHEKGVIAVTFSPDSRSLVTFGGDETVRRWDLNINSLIDRARRVAGRELTPDERKLYHLD